jgi:type II secretory pathway component PulJ
MILKIRVESGLLRVIATGEFSLEEAERTFLEMFDAVAQHKTPKVLVDGRELKGKPSTFERFFYGEFVAQAVKKQIIKHGEPHDLQFAYVVQEPVLEPQRFGETVAVNRGMWVKAFDNIEDALGWLRRAPVNESEHATLDRNESQNA